MRFQAAWLLSCGHERGFTRPEDEPAIGEKAQCYVCPAVNTPTGRVAPARNYVRKVR